MSKTPQDINPIETMHERALAVNPMGLESLPPVDFLVPRFPMSEITMRRVGIGGLVAAGAAVGAVLSFAPSAVGAAEAKSCPKAPAQLEAPITSPGVVGLLPESGVPDIAVTSQGITGGYGCTSATENIRYSVENQSDTTAPVGSSLSISTNGGVKIPANGVSLNGNVLGADVCDYTSTNSNIVSCKLPEEILPQEKMQVDVAALRTTPGIGSVNFGVFGTLPEYNYDNNRVSLDALEFVDASAQSGGSAGGDNAGNLPPAKVLVPKIVFTGFRSQKIKKGQRGCMTSQFVLRTAEGEPVARNVSVTMLRQPLIKFRTGTRGYRSAKFLGDANSGINAYSSLRACTKNGKPVRGTMVFKGDNLEEFRVATTFNFQTKRWKVSRILRAKNTPAPQIAR